MVFVLLSMFTLHVSVYMAIFNCVGVIVDGLAFCCRCSHYVSAYMAIFKCVGVIVDGLRFVVDVHTTCFGLHGHLQECKIFYFLVL
jgi:hypothetical protein